MTRRECHHGSWRDACSFCFAEQRFDQIREAVAQHARALDDIARGKADERDRDDIDNALYNEVRAFDPEWWDETVPGLARTSAEGPDAASRTPTPWELWRDIDPDLFGGAP